MSGLISTESYSKSSTFLLTKASPTVQTLLETTRPFSSCNTTAFQTLPAPQCPIGESETGTIFHNTTHPVSIFMISAPLISASFEVTSTNHRFERGIILSEHWTCAGLLENEAKISKLFLLLPPPHVSDITQ